MRDHGHDANWNKTPSILYNSMKFCQFDRDWLIGGTLRNLAYKIPSNAIGVLDS